MEVAVRRVYFLLLCLTLCLSVGTAFAQSNDQNAPPDDESAPAEDQAPPGPVLKPADYSPLICDPSAAGFRYLEVRGSGFDAWATQRLVGNVVDATGVPRIHWGSVWVSPAGQLTLEVNLCADPFRNRPALAAGDYTVAVGQDNGAPIAATGISLMSPPEEDQTEPRATVTPRPPTPTSTPFVYVLPALPDQSSGSPTQLPIPALATPTPTAGPHMGPGSLQQPLPLGAPGTLVDGWQLVITGISPDSFKGIQTENPSATPPASDQRDFILRAQATYQGPGTGSFSGVRLALLSSVTQLVYDQINNTCGVIPDSLPPNVVTSGNTVRGNICFQVRASDIGSLVAFDNQPADSDKVYFALQ
jgi:hypothetical protein